MCVCVCVCACVVSRRQCLLYLQIRTGRDSSSAEDNILHFLQACNALGVEKVSMHDGIISALSFLS